MRSLNMGTILYRSGVSAFVFLLAGSASAGEAGTLWKFDFGTKDSPVWQGFAQVTKETVYSPERGHGLVKITPEIRAVDRGEPDDLWRDFLTGPNLEFNVDVPNGTYEICTWTKDLYLQPFQMRTSSIWAQGVLKTTEKIDQTNLCTEQYYYKHLNDDYRKSDDLWTKYILPEFEPKIFTTEVTDGQLRLRFVNCAVNGLVVYPRKNKPEAQEFLGQLRREQRAAFGYKELRHEETTSLRVLTAAERKRGYLLFARSCLDRIYPNTVPKDVEIGKPLEMFVARNEIESTGFGIYPLKALPGITVTVTDLKSSGGDTISRENIRVQAVKYMEFAVKAKEYEVRPWLLMNWKDIDIEAGVTKQYVVTVVAPRQARPGNYQAVLTVKPAGGEAADLLLRLKVLPFCLEDDPGYIRGLYYSGPWVFSRQSTVQPEDGEMMWKVMSQEFSLLRDFGYNTVSPEAFLPGIKRTDDKMTLDCSETDKFMETYTRAGLSAPIPWYGMMSCWGQEATKGWQRLTGRWPSEQFFAEVKSFAVLLQNRRREKGWPEILFYLNDEIGSDRERLLKTMQVGKALKEIPGIRTCASILSPQELALTPLLDYTIMNYGVPVNADSIKRIREAGSTVGLYNMGAYRFTHGFFLWRVGGRVMLSWMANAYHGQPYNDFDGNENYNWIFPSPAGPLATLKLLEAREGIDDMKYLHTLTLLIEQGRKSAAPEVRKAAEESRKSLDEIRQYVRDDFNYYAKEKGFWETDVYDRLRWRVALEIMSLEEKLCVR